MQEKNFKNGQLSFFILIGFIILIVTAFLFYVNKRSTEYKTQKESAISQQTSYDITSIKSYITACLEKTAKDGMKMLGEQGGVIYPQQGGIPLAIGGIPWEPQINTDYVILEETKNNVKTITNVSYGLIGPIGSLAECGNVNISCFNEIRPVSSIDGAEKTFVGGGYPWINFSIKPGLRKCGSLGCFGYNMMPQLEKNYSMYNQLRHYIKNTIKNCTNFSIFKGFKIETSDNLDVNVTTSDQTVIAVLSYPINITDPTTKKSTRLDRFYYDTKIRLKRLHNLSYEMINKDKDNENFNITTDSGSIPTFDSGHMKISILKHSYPDLIIQNDRDNIVRISDNFSSPTFTFQFARKNRHPILDNITSPKHITYNAELSDANFSNINKLDPDEENTIMYFSSQYSALNLPEGAPKERFNKMIDDNFCDPFGGSNTFTINVCVSDNNSINPFSPLCIYSDTSRDWQIITFIVDNCPQKTK
jgi:hypothetical protein